MIRIFVTLLAVLACISAQEQTLEQLIAQNPQVGVVLNNYFGCAKWDPVETNVCL